MANKNFKRVQAVESEVKHVYAKVAIGASGAPTLSVGYGVTSISRTSAGLYRITLADTYASLKWFHCITSGASAADMTCRVKAEDVASAKTIDFWTLTGATATDPSSGDTLYIKIELKNTSIV
jgi:hypothetical protein